MVRYVNGFTQIRKIGHFENTFAKEDLLNFSICVPEVHMCFVYKKVYLSHLLK
jgi:hypothetical protein